MAIRSDNRVSISDVDFYGFPNTTPPGNVLGSLPPTCDLELQDNSEIRIGGQIFYGYEFKHLLNKPPSLPKFLYINGCNTGSCNLI